MRRDPHGMTKKREDEIRAKHKDHPYCDACEVLAQLDIERGGHQLELLALQAKVDEARRRLVGEVLGQVKLRGEKVDGPKSKS